MWVFGKKVINNPYCLHQQIAPAIYYNKIEMVHMGYWKEIYIAQVFFKLSFFF